MKSRFVPVEQKCNDRSVIAFKKIFPFLFGQENPNSVSRRGVIAPGGPTADGVLGRRRGEGRRAGPGTWTERLGLVVHRRLPVGRLRASAEFFRRAP